MVRVTVTASKGFSSRKPDDPNLNSDTSTSGEKLGYDPMKQP